MRVCKSGSKSGLNRSGGFDYFNVALLFFITLVVVYPLWNVLMISFNHPVDTLQGGIYFFFRKFTLSNYEYFFKNKGFLNSLVVSVGRTVLGAASSVLVTTMFAYGMSKKHLIGRKFWSAFMIIPLYISGGLIPQFLIVKSIGFYHNFFVYIILTLFSTYNCIILMTFFKGIPAEIEESVRMDGGNDLVIFFKIIFPISMPVIATIALFNAVYQWNSWFDTVLYGGRQLMTLQAKLVEIIRDADAARKLETEGSNLAASLMNRLGFRPTVESVKSTAMVISAVPIMMVYPFLQKYFVKGIMIGSIKG